MRRLPLVLLLAAAIGCGDYLGPDRGDPAQYAFDAPFMFTGCSGRAPNLPDVKLGLFDVYWGARDEDDREEGPDPRLVRLVIQHGGTIVHKFNIPMVRAILPPSALPKLDANSIRGVTDPQNYWVSVFVGFRGPIDEEAITGRGGTVVQRYITLPFVAAYVTDAVIPSLRQDARVDRVGGALGVACTL